jgi:small-conductance mechanosensitive channel
LNTGRRAVLALALVVFVSGAVVAEAQPPPTPSAQAGLTAVIGAERAGETATVMLANRPIVVLRARVLGRSPSERAIGAERSLDDLVAEGITGPVESSLFADGSRISVATRAIIVLTMPDVDDLTGETIQSVTAQAIVRLQQALAEASEARTPGRLLGAGALALLALAAGVVVIWGLRKVHSKANDRLEALSESRIAKFGKVDVEAVRASRLLDFQRGMVTGLILLLELLVTYSVVTFVLRQFPYTRPWGESLSGFLLTTVESLALGFLNGLPGLFTVVLIFIITRFIVRLSRLWFYAVERGRIKVHWLYPETAQPTRRIVTGLLWLFAAVVAYPYLPGSETDAFKGVSVFLGLMVTLGSSGIVNQIMSGFTITYSRALREGDFVKIGDVEGTVVHLGVLSTKIRTLLSEDVTVPNALVVSQTTTDYSRFPDTVFTKTSVTIGYDAPWRQVHALLLGAAERTPGVRSEPKPVVLQTALQDFYVQYTLWVSLVRQEDRLTVMNSLYANIQDLFNEYGVQIMSPNYVFDPNAPKVVPKQNWFAAPAKEDGK